MNASDIEKHPELFDLPGDCRPRRIFFATGSRPNPKYKGKDKRKKTIDHSAYINSPTLTIAKRVALQEMRFHRCRLGYIHEISWREYGNVLAKAGMTISGFSP